MSLKEKSREASEAAVEKFMAENPDAKKIFSQEEIGAIKEFFVLGFAEGYFFAISEMKEILEGKEADPTIIPSLPKDEAEKTE